MYTSTCSTELCVVAAAHVAQDVHAQALLHLALCWNRGIITKRTTFLFSKH